MQPRNLQMRRAGVYPTMEKCRLTKSGGEEFNLTYRGVSWTMKLVTHFFRRNIARLTAIALLVTLYLLAQQPTLSTAERVSLASKFRFTRSSLYEVPAQSYRSHRVVNPS